MSNNDFNIADRSLEISFPYVLFLHPPYPCLPSLPFKYTPSLGFLWVYNFDDLQGKEIFDETKD